MKTLTIDELEVKLTNILDTITNGTYTITQNENKDCCHVVIYDNAKVGVFAGLYPVNHKNNEKALLRLEETIQLINKI